MWASDLFITSALMRQGAVLCSPIHPMAAVTIRALELFHIAQLHSPYFSVQAFVKTLCDLQGVIFQCYLSHQFSIAFDLYLQIHGHVDSIVSQVLQWDSENWCLKHACVACTYKLTDEPKLKFKLLYVMDGNDSLKCILWHLPDETADNYPPLSCDLPTDPISNKCDNKSAKDSDPNLCARCWKNMDAAKTKKTWGVYDETGIFMVVCHHGTSLLIADMVQSGKHAKYPLVVVSKLMATFSDGLSGGYDIGCQFQTTLVMRLGLEDLETCERMFSKSNTLASTLRYATTFHQQQAINTYFKHNNIFEIYANLTNFLFDNYKQTLTIIHDSKAVLTNLKHDLSIDDDGIFHRWLEEEKKYLKGLSHEPPEEMLHMEYWQRLGKLEVSSQQLCEILDTWNIFKLTDSTTYGCDMRVTQWNKTLRQHAQENYDKDLLVVQELEHKLNVSQHWTPEDKEWQHVGCLVANREYHHVLDTLESLVVARIFELTKMNRAGTGYKLWKHIAKALQTHSAAIKTLHWEQVVEYAFLADFNLLQDTHENISQCPWAHPTVHFTLDTYFKMTCKEKINNIHPTLGHQVSQCHKLHLQFNGSHLKCLHDIAMLPGFTGTLIPGVSALKGPGESSSKPAIIIPSSLLAPVQPPPSQIPHRNVLDSIEDLEEEEEVECEAEEASHALQDVLEVSFDPV
ncbi:hypothetical protein F5141DRAFT_1191877 [Pisolithus sp. B1]|nr:hypothetical protein F5141DRAFT_1191877 [Pisolithus sp. B1]